jgi:hypothetical protein
MSPTGAACVRVCSVRVQQEPPEENVVTGALPQPASLLLPQE